MKTALLILALALTTSCGKQSATQGRSVSGSSPLKINSVIVIYTSLTSAELSDFSKGTTKYFSLDCGSSADKNACVDASLKEAIKNKYDLCVFDPGLPESELLGKAIENCGYME